MKFSPLNRFRPIIILFAAGMLLQATAVHAIDVSRYRFHSMPKTSYYGGIRYIAKDSVGRMWFSDEDAVFMYNGVGYERMNDAVTYLSPSSLWSYGPLASDRDRTLYMGTNNGLLRFNYGTLRFEFVMEGNIKTVAVDKDNVLWLIGNEEIQSYDANRTPEVRKYKSPSLLGPRYNLSLICTGDGVYVATNGVIYQLDPDTGSYRRIAKIGNELCLIYDAVEHDGLLYVLSQMDGIFCYDSTGQLVRHFKLPVEFEKSAEAKKLYLDQEGIIWVATQSGLMLLDPIAGESTLVRTDFRYSWSLPNDSVWSIYPDPDGGVWIGTYGGKLAYMAFDDNDFACFKATQGMLNHPIVSCFAEDPEGNIWIGTEGGGISYWNRATTEFTYYNLETNCGLTSNMIKSLSYDSQGRLMVSTFHGGIQEFDKQTGRFVDVVSRDNPPMSVYGFVTDVNGGMWMSDPDARLMYKGLSDSSMEEVHFSDGHGGELRLKIETLFLDMQGNLWMLTHTGVYIMGTETRRIISRIFIEDAPYPVNNLCSYCRSTDGTVWFGTRGGGVNCLKVNGIYTNFHDKNGNGLDGLMVFGILEDSATGDLWFSTDDGLYFYRKDEEIISKSTIDMPDFNGAYYVRSCFRTSRGEMLFGGTDGFVLFSPKRLEHNPREPKVYFTDLLINNEKITPETKNSPLKRDISTISYNGDNEGIIVLSHKASNFEIRFSSDAYLDSEKNLYSYRMTGLNDQWSVLPHGQQAVQFANLPSGTYVLEIRAVDSNGQWGDKTASLRFRKKPSPFLSLFAFFIYAVFAVSIIVFIWRYFTDKKFYEQKIELERVREENMRELTKARINFFTNISHDLKTPLTLIVDPLKQLKEQIPEDSTSGTYVRLIERNAGRIQHIISQLLKFREIESLNITLDKRPGDIIKFIESIFQLFEFYADKKGIKTEFNSQYESFHTEFDSDVVEKIFTNLFSNAIKYTSENGYVGVDIRKASTAELPKNASVFSGVEYICVIVTNTSSGIPDDQKNQIFKQFSRVPGFEPQFEGSTGLGLAIVRELVENMEGVVSLQSDNSKVSFTVVLPLTLNVPQNEEVEDSFEYTISEIDNMMVESEEIHIPEKVSRKAENLLVIEDDPPLRTYIEQSLSKYYNVYTASNGIEGIKRVEKILPTVVVTDLIMPKADGFEVCRRIRANVKTSHIPVIVLSAAGNNDENKVKALECGANVFIDKPVDMDYLIKQTANLIKSQKDLKERYSKKFIVDPVKVETSSMDEELLQRAMDCIEKNIGNSEYGVDDFVDDMLIGRTRLYQKIKDLTDMSIKEFIMDIRLKRAEQLLRESDLTIAEISDMTGFSNSKYFSVCFKTRFGATPSDYKKRS